MIPIPLVHILLIAIAIWKIKGILKYRHSTQLFFKDVGKEWIDTSKAKSALKSHMLLESFPYVSMSILPFFLYFKETSKLLMPLGLVLLVIWFIGSLVWIYVFKKN